MHIVPYTLFFNWNIIALQCYIRFIVQQGESAVYTRILPLTPLPLPLPTLWVITELWAELPVV